MTQVLVTLISMAMDAVGAATMLAELRSHDKQTTFGTLIDKNDEYTVVRLIDTEKGIEDAETISNTANPKNDPIAVWANPEDVRIYTGAGLRPLTGKEIAGLYRLYNKAGVNV